MISFSNPERAYYAPSKDVVNMPRLEAFHNSESYYFTLFHELIHSTAHPDRLNRKEGLLNKRYNKAYCLEELVAEMGANILSDHCGLNLDVDSLLLKNTASYIQGYLNTFKGNRMIFFQAARQAAKAASYILGRTGQETMTEED